MRNIFQITKDMRDVAKIANELADEMDKIFALFTGGPNVPFEKPAKDLVRSKSNGSPKSYAGVKANDQQKLLIRQLWFSHFCWSFAFTPA